MNNYIMRLAVGCMLAVSVLTVSQGVCAPNGNDYFKAWTNGLPTDPSTFPIAVWLQSPNRAQSYKDIGINLYIGLWDGPTESQLNQLQAVGMPVICNQNTFALTHLAQYQGTIVGWMYLDEPDNAQKWAGSDEWGRCYLPGELVAIYDDIVANDATRPVYLNFGQGVVQGTGYLGRWYLDEEHLGPGNDYSGENYAKYYTEASEAADILSFDIYPVASGYNNLWYVGEGIANLKSWAAQEMPTWCWIETTRISGTVKPTPAQVRAEVWMAIIHGATGIGYFCHEFNPAFNEDALLDDSDMRDGVDAINQEVQGYAPVINSRVVDSNLSVGVTTNGDAEVKALMKWHLGYFYLFSICLRDEPVQATFSITGLDDPGATAEVLNEGRTIALNGGLFTDAFNGYGIHIYRIPHTFIMPGDVNLDYTVDLTDLIRSLEVMTDSLPAGEADKAADVDNDGRIGLEEAIYILRQIGGLTD